VHVMTVSDNHTNLQQQLSFGATEWGRAFVQL